MTSSLRAAGPSCTACRPIWPSRDQRTSGAGSSYEIREGALLGRGDGGRGNGAGASAHRLRRPAGRTAADVDVTIVRVSPSATYRLQGRGALSLSVTRSGGRERARVASLHLGQGSLSGVTSEWRLSGDYSLNRYLTGSVSYTGEARPDAADAPHAGHEGQCVLLGRGSSAGRPRPAWRWSCDGPGGLRGSPGADGAARGVVDVEVEGAESVSAGDVRSILVPDASASFDPARLSARVDSLLALLAGLGGRLAAADVAWTRGRRRRAASRLARRGGAGDARHAGAHRRSPRRAPRRRSRTAGCAREVSSRGTPSPAASSRPARHVRGVGAASGRRAPRRRLATPDGVSRSRSSWTRGRSSGSAISS